MRSTLYLAATIMLSGCGSASEGLFQNSTPDATAGTGGAASSGGGSNGGAGPEMGPPTLLAPGAASLVGVTSDDWVVFRDSEALRAVRIGNDPSVEEITERPGSVLIRGSVVFNWAEIDWTIGVGDLSVWSVLGGYHDIGLTLYAEGLVGASQQGSNIVYTANTQEQTMDLMVAPSDLSSPQVLIESMGRGSETTCGASIGFVGERLIVGWCEAGSRVAKIERYELVGGQWQATLIAADALPEWSADATGERIFYQSTEYGAHFAEDGAAHLIDAGVSRGLLLPDGSAALYTVGDQLRRSTLPEVNPIPIVTKGYSQPIEFSPDFNLALYSTTVTYDDGTRRDLRLVTTDGFNPAPIELVPEAVATLPRSSMTHDGRFVMYLTDMAPTGSTLHIVAIDGTERLVLPNVVEVVAANDSTLVFTDNSSDPEQYPVVADLKVVDLATDAEPRLIEAKVVEARSFQLDATREKVVYVRSGVDRDASDFDREGVFFRRIR